MKKKYIIISAFLGCVTLAGFQMASDINLHMLQSPGYQIPNYVEPDYDLGDGHIDNLKPYPDVKKGEQTPFRFVEIWG